MSKFKSVLAIILVNILLILLPLAAVEGYYRYFRDDLEVPANALWQRFQPYVMFTTVAQTYTGWSDTFTGELIPAEVTTNSIGFRDDREFDFSKPYEKGPKEKVVLFTGGSAAWGVGATHGDTTIPGRMQHYLNEAQDEYNYTVVNLGMGSYIAYQQAIAMDLWGESFDPEWVVVFDGFNDASVGCGYAQGAMYPMYFAIMKSYIEGYLLNSTNPPFYRGEFFNELLKHSHAVRKISGESYIEKNQAYDENNTEATYRGVINPDAKVGDAPRMVDFYVKAQRTIANRFSDANVIFTTQPSTQQVNNLWSDYYHQAGTGLYLSRRESLIKRYDESIAPIADQPCNKATYNPAMYYVYAMGALGVEAYVEELRQAGRNASYYNTSMLLPAGIPERRNYFIDVVHLKDNGMDIVGRFLAGRILRSDLGIEVPTDYLPDELLGHFAPEAVTARAETLTGITAVAATYGASCGAVPGNATASVATDCLGKEQCDYSIDVYRLGDPAGGCSKDFKVDWQCADDAEPHSLYVEDEAGYPAQTIQLVCGE
ncbi:MAG: hypothetical protein RLW87_21920 [Alphaproteobacteria bacterium]